jgi:hypothetical protein
VGTVSVDPASGIFTYDGPAGFTGVETFTYTVTDREGRRSPPARVTVIVQPPPAYRLLGADGGVFDFGSAPYEHSCLDTPISCGRITGGASYRDGLGYWLTNAEGSVFSFGDAPFLGSLPGLGQGENDIVAMTATPDGGGYWLVGADGSVYAFGDAPYAGSLPGLGLSVGDVVGLAPTADGGGYWLVGADGSVYAFGDAPYLGNASGLRLERPVVGISAGPAGGYWLVAGDGGVFSFTPPFLGSDPAIGFWPPGTLGVPKVLNGPIVAMVPGESRS